MSGATRVLFRVFGRDTWRLCRPLGASCNGDTPGIAGKSRPPVPRWIEDRQTLTDIMSTPGRALTLDHTPDPCSLTVFRNGILLVQGRGDTLGEYKVGVSDDGKIHIEVADLRWKDVLTIRYQTWDGAA